MNGLMAWVSSVVFVIAIFWRGNLPCFMRAFWRGEYAKAYLFPVIQEPRSPLVSEPGHAHQSRGAITMVATVAHVLKLGDIPQIAQPIVGGVTVYVVGLDWHLAVSDEPSKLMSAEVTLKYPDCDIAVRGDATRPLSSIFPVPRPMNPVAREMLTSPRLPSKESCVGIVIKKLFGNIVGYNFTSHAHTSYVKLVRGLVASTASTPHFTGVAA